MFSLTLLSVSTIIAQLDVTLKSWVLLLYHPEICFKRWQNAKMKSKQEWNFESNSGKCQMWNLSSDRSFQTNEANSIKWLRATTSITLNANGVESRITPPPQKKKKPITLWSPFFHHGITLMQKKRRRGNKSYNKNVLQWKSSALKCSNTLKIVLEVFLTAHYGHMELREHTRFTKVQASFSFLWEHPVFPALRDN